MVDHVAVNVADWEAAKRFYEATLGPLGYRILYEEEGAIAYYADERALDFGIGRREPVGGAHVAFKCPDKESVHRFYEAGLAAGGRDNGPPGPRPQYAPDYYAAFVLDPDGNNIEAVCHIVET
jgi:catechol 2,3-dioxygenase-like lactoylglutathione lyase family enzyme